MGTKNTWKCGSCNYSELTSGGMDMGFAGYFNTFVCGKCKVLVDLLVEPIIFLEPDTPNPNPDLPAKGQKCDNCRTRKHLIIWNKKTCPKCEGMMKIDKNGLEMMWD